MKEIASDVDVKYSISIAQIVFTVQIAVGNQNTALEKLRAAHRLSNRRL